MVGTLFVAHRVLIDIGVLGLWIGPGLLRREPRYRTWAVRLLVASFILLPLAALLLALQAFPPTVRMFDRPIGAVPYPVVLATLAALLGISIWLFLVLNAPGVRAQFDKPPSPSDVGAPSV